MEKVSADGDVTRGVFANCWWEWLSRITIVENSINMLANGVKI